MSQSTFAKFEKVAGLLIVKLEREKIGDYESPIIRAEIEKEAATIAWKVVVDLADVRLIASAGLGMLVALNGSCKKGGGRLAICNMDPNLKQVFELTKLHRVLAIHDDRDRAVKSLL